MPIDKKYFERTNAQNIVDGTEGAKNGDPISTSQTFVRPLPEHDQRVATCKSCKEPISKAAEICPSCGVRQFFPGSTKSRGCTILIILFLGAWGIHKFYLGQPGRGLFYLLFSWTLIPAALAYFDMLRFLLMSNETFATKYR